MQDTEYPWSGRVRITIDRCDDREFALKLRIPGWASGATLRRIGYRLVMVDHPGGLGAAQ